MKETDFQTKNCRSAMKITHSAKASNIEKQRQRDVRSLCSRPCTEVYGLCNDLQKAVP